MATGIFCTPHLEEVTGFINALYKHYDNSHDVDAVEGIVNNI